MDRGEAEDEKRSVFSVFCPKTAKAHKNALICTVGEVAYIVKEDDAMRLIRYWVAKWRLRAFPVLRDGVASVFTVLAQGCLGTASFFLWLGGVLVGLGRRCVRKLKI